MALCIIIFVALRRRHPSTHPMTTVSAWVAAVVVLLGGSFSCHVTHHNHTTKQGKCACYNIMMAVPRWWSAPSSSQPNTTHNSTGFGISGVVVFLCHYFITLVRVCAHGLQQQPSSTRPTHSFAQLGAVYVFITAVSLSRNWILKHALNSS